jgi:polysaccharide biosynthesis/export protein
MKAEIFAIAVCFTTASATAQALLNTRPAEASAKPLTTAPAPIHDYVLGPDDQIKVWALGFEEFSDKPLRIDPGGYLSLPYLGEIKAAGLTTLQLQHELEERMKKSVLNPQVAVTIIDYGSQPVSVLGAVNQPGVHQLQGHRTLTEVLSMAGGTRPDAGATVHISRLAQWGMIPLPGAKMDPSGQYSTAELRITDLFAANNPGDNIQILPHDVVTVEVTQTVSVIGAVQKPGAFPLNTKASVSALEALAMAGGTGPQPAKPQEARILRLVPGQIDRREIPINLQKIQEGKEEDVALRPNDILLVPVSNKKKFGMAFGSALMAAAVGAAIFRPF